MDGSAGGGGVVRGFGIPDRAHPSGTCTGTRGFALNQPIGNWNTAAAACEGKPPEKGGRGTEREKMGRSTRDRASVPRVSRDKAVRNHTTKLMLKLTFQ